jgi:uncharacterized protein YndB with AHSA1/START domain
MIEVSTTIKASADQIWKLIGDPTRMGEWSPECQRVEWAGSGSAESGSAGPGLNARFKGHNRFGWRRWTTTGTIVRYTPGREIAWNVDFARQPIASWSYRIDPDPAGASCTVVETFRDLRSRTFQVLGPVARGVKDVDTHNRAGMEETLARIKAAAES